MILHLTLQSGILLGHSTETTLVRTTNTFHVAESCGNYQASSYLYLSAGFGVTDHSLLPEQVLSLAVNIPYHSGFPSSSLAMPSWLNSSPLLDLKILKFPKTPDLNFLLYLNSILGNTQHFKSICVLIPNLYFHLTF